MVKGINLAIMELFLFFFIFSNLISFNENIQNFDSIVVYWLGFTVLTGIWELTYVFNKDEVNRNANFLINHRKSVWNSEYTLSSLLPNKFSKIFYSEYAAWADREYMSFNDNWSITIEGSHCIVCALFSLLCLWSIINEDDNNFYISLGIGMGSQFMNSLLYLEEYFIQINDINNINYNNKEFPSGDNLSKRPFMYINLLWIFLPAYSILTYTSF